MIIYGLAQNVKTQILAGYFVVQKISLLTRPS